MPSGLTDRSTTMRSSWASAARSSGSRQELATTGDPLTGSRVIASRCGPVRTMLVALAGAQVDPAALAIDLPTEARRARRRALDEPRDVGDALEVGQRLVGRVLGHVGIGGRGHVVVTDGRGEDGEERGQLSAGLQAR